MAMIRTVQFSGILDDLKGSVDGWKSDAEEQIRKAAESLKQENEKLIKDLIKAGEKKADEVASREATTAAETHAKTLKKELRPYLIGTVAIICVVGAAVAYKLVR